MTTVGLDWALLGKDAGQRDDYRILHSSTKNIRPATLARMISHFSPGSPAGENPGSYDELPWVTFTAATVSGTPYVGVAIREWPADPTTEVDATGRTTVPTRFFCLPVADFTMHVGSFTMLYEAVEGIDLKTASRHLQGELLVVDLAPRPVQDPRRSAGTAILRDPTQVRAALAAAALVLDNQVLLTVTPGIRRLADRIAFLDAVAALLPAGTDAILSAGTWVDNRTSHQVRLAFAERLRDDQPGVNPQDPPDLSRLGTIRAQNYATMLANLVRPETTDCADGVFAVDHRRLRTVLGWLSGDTESHTFSQPDSIVAALAAPAAEELHERFDAGNIGVDDIRHYLRSTPTPADPAGGLLMLLVADPAPGDIRLAVNHWVPRMRPALVALVRALVAVGTDYEDLAPDLQDAPSDILAWLVRALLEPEPGRSDIDSDIMDLAVDIVRNYYDSGDCWNPVQEMLVARQPLGMHLLLRHVDLRGSVGLRDLLNWLTGTHPPAWGPALRPFQVLVANSRVQLSVDISDVAYLGGLPETGDRAVRTLLKLAVILRQEAQVLLAVEKWLRNEVDDAPFGRERRAEWLTVINQVDPRYHNWQEQLGVLVAAPWPKHGRLPRPGGHSASGESGASGFRAAPGTNVSLGVRWVQAGEPVGRGDAAGVAWLASRYNPDRPATGDIRGELSFFGDAEGRVAVVLSGSTAPAEPRGEIGPAWCCFTEFDSLVTAGGSVATFCLAARAVTDGQRPDRLPMLVPGLGQLAGIVDVIGFGLVAATAARLLEGPVTVVMDGGRVPPIDWRLAFVDAVLALLPVGVRASMTVCSWSDGSRDDRFRLVFADSVTPGRQAVRWACMPATEPVLTSCARDYHRRLMLVRTLLRDTEEIVRIFAALDTAMDLDVVDCRLPIVTESNPVFFISTAPGKNLDKAREQMKATLGGRLGKEDSDVRALGALLGTGGLNDIEAAFRYAERLREVGRLDRVIAGLVRLKDSDSDRRTRVRRGAVDLLRAAVTAEPWERSCAAVRDVAGAAVDLLVLETRSGRLSGLAAWLAWLSGPGVLPAELLAFQVVLGGEGTLSEDHLTKLARFGDDALLALLHLAYYQERHGGVLWVDPLLAAVTQMRPHIGARFGRFVLSITGRGHDAVAAGQPGTSL